MIGGEGRWSALLIFDVDIDVDVGVDGSRVVR